MQEFVATYNNWFRECVIIERNQVNKRGPKKKQKGKGKQKGEDNKDEETGDDEIGE